MTKRLIVVDVSSFIFRAYFAVRPMHSPEGTPVNAVYGLLTMLLKLINDYKPTHMFIAKDTKDGSFRKEIYEPYKANRSEAPLELIPQFFLVDELICKLKIKASSYKNYEADDVIGSVVSQLKNHFDEVLIASGDKDLMQYIGENAKMIDTMKNLTYGRSEVIEKMGVLPEQIVDYLSIVGDSSDNIPGVKGIGVKGAQALLKEFKNLEDIYSNIDQVKPERSKKSLIEGKEEAFLSKKLATIVSDIKLELEPEDLKFSLDVDSELITFLASLNFNSLVKKLQDGERGNISSPAITFVRIKDLNELKNEIKNIQSHDQVSIDFFLEGKDYHFNFPEMLSLSTTDKNYILNREILNEETLSFLFVELKELKIIFQDSKIFYFYLKMLNIENSFDTFDLTQAHFALDPDRKHDLQTISLELLKKDLVSENEVLKYEKLEDKESWLARCSNHILYAYPQMLKELMQRSLFKLFDEIDNPLIPILAEMEFNGITLDKNFYETLEKKFEEELKIINEEIIDEAQDNINLRSPKQVGELLFEKLKLPVVKKTKTGFSTDSDVLQKLDSMGLSKIPGLILKNRELEKLLSTYVKTFPSLIHPKTRRIHTHFLQNVASTGRLSSENPNLQNIPIRMENGRKLREGFVAKEGYSLIGADYSQVELRILAHFSEDEVMVKSFLNDEDIHYQTACEVFSKTTITPDERSFAKAINFGLMYGQTSFGLSQTLNISQGEAKEYITKYFTRFHKVKLYLDSLKEECEKNGYTTTLYGRKRNVVDINSNNRQVKSMAERIAINTPIQGTAADIIKLAMLKISKNWKKENIDGSMLLQIHDELIFEVKDEDTLRAQSFIKNTMENIVKLNVPLKVDTKIGKNWYLLK